MWKFIHYIINKIFTPINGLGKRLFLIVSQLTPICNVELVIKDNLNKTLLIFRDDGFYGPGWHLPGGIIRFREKVKSRILKTLAQELNIKNGDIDLLRLISCVEVINSKKILRSHFLSLVYLVKLSRKNNKFPLFDENIVYRHGDIAYHHKCPENIIKEHLRFKKIINENDSRKRYIIEEVNTINF